MIHLKLFRYILILSLIFSVFACKSTKFVPDEQYLLDKITIQSDLPAYQTAELKPYVKQQPNFKMFGLFKTMLGVYNLSGKKDNYVNRLMRKMGEEPVLYDAQQEEKTVREFQKLFVNMGYLNAETWSVVDTSRHKKASVDYYIQSNEPYRIRHYETEINDSILNREMNPQHNSLVRDSSLFDRNVLDSERDRLTGILKKRGYYAFSKDLLMYEADSASDTHSVDLKLRLREMPDSVLNIANRKFFYDQFRIYLDYDPLKMAGVNEYPKRDSIQINGYTIYYQGKKPSLRPNMLLNNCYITPHESYSQEKEELTYLAFSSLRALDNIYIQYSEKIRNDSTLLDGYMLVLPARKQSISNDIEGTNTAGDLGIASSVNYSHRNLFRRSETLNFRLRAAYETMSNFSNPYLEFGGEVSLHIPRILFPYIDYSISRRYRVSTEFLLKYNYQTRPEYDRTLLAGGLRYQWQNRQKFSPRHQFDLLDVDYVYLPRTDPEFMSKLPPNAQYFGYTDQFIVGMAYSYYRSTFEAKKKQKNAHTLRFSLESAGSALYGLCAGINTSRNEKGSYQILNTPFAQFVKGDFDYTYNIPLDRQNSIAWRIGGGIGYPYGNSQILPFEKRYYSGGANSVRAWSIRELGPGSYSRNSSTTFYHQTGDIKFNFNIEFRSHFFWKLEAAVYVDAGNIWTIKDYEGQEGGKFRFNSFYKEIAVGYGLGLRLDFDYFLIRFDTGMKAYNPAQTGKERWAILNPNFKDNFAWHIAVGYPF